MHAESGYREHWRTHAPRGRLALLLSATTLVAALASACATGSAAVDASPAPAQPAGATAARPTGPSAALPTQPLPARWPVRTAAHVDLWLHCFAMISSDTAAVPLFKRGYADSLSAIKRRGNVLTSLDANRTTLAKRLTANPALVQAQFLALQFASFTELKTATDRFLQFQGEAQRAPDAATAALVSQLAVVFPAAADREWLRLFMAGVLDEQARFYDAEYQRVLRERASVVSAVDALWQSRYRAKFERFLTNTSQRQGELLLSLPLGGEGRTSVTATGGTVVVAPLPGRSEDAGEAIFVLAHEVVGNLVSAVVADNTTPAEQRSGASGAFVSFAQVQGGLLLLQKIAPELVEPYARYYVGQGRRRITGADGAAALRSAYPLPQAITDALVRQIEIVLAGI